MNNGELSEYRVTMMLKYFETEGTLAMAKRLGVHKCTISRWARDLGLKDGRTRRGLENDTCDKDYFRTWSHNMAYVLGFLFADGSINETGGTLSVNVNSDDIAVVEFIKKELKTDNSIDVRPPRGKTRESVLLRINSVVLVKSLNDFGLFHNKTYRDDPMPDVPQKFFPSFVRGFLDGDGSIYLSKPNSRGSDRCNLRFIGPVKFIRELNSRLAAEFGMVEKRLRIERGKKAVWATVTWTNPKCLSLFRKFVYSNPQDFAMDRKRTILEEWLDKPRIEMKVWDNKSEQIVKDLFSNLGPLKISKMVGRDYDTVIRKAVQLGVAGKYKARAERNKEHRRR